MSQTIQTQAKYLSTCLNTIMLSRHGLGPNVTMELIANNCITDIEIMLCSTHLFSLHNQEVIPDQIVEVAHHHRNTKACHLCVNNSIADEDLTMCPTSVEKHNFRSNLRNPSLFQKGNTNRCRDSTRHEMYVIIGAIPCAP